MERQPSLLMIVRVSQDHRCSRMLSTYTKGSIRLIYQKQWTTRIVITPLTDLSMFIGSTSAKLEPIRSLSPKIPLLRSWALRFMGRHLLRAFAMLFALRLSNFRSSSSSSGWKKTHFPNFYGVVEACGKVLETRNCVASVSTNCDCFQATSGVSITQYIQVNMFSTSIIR